MARWSIVLALASALEGCDAKDGGPAPVCDPFDANARPIELRTILGIGRAADGTIYLADHADDEADHVFVSENDELVRRSVSFGFSDDDDPAGLRHVFDVEPDPRFTLQIFVPPDASMGMGVVREEILHSFLIGEVGEELEVVGEDAIATMPLRNLSGAIELEYAAETNDDELLVVTRPSDFEGYEEFRFFLGPPSIIEERIIHSTIRELDGGTTTIEFDLDGVVATAYFPADRHDLPWTLTIADDTTQLARLDAVPDGAAFHCASE